MTIEALVAEAYSRADIGPHFCEERQSPNGCRGCTDCAAHLLATPAGQTLARWAAIGEAVERLPSDKPWTLANIPSACYAVSIYPDGTERNRIGVDGSTILDAINAALGGEG
jgi:hypothetical protein